MGPARLGRFCRALFLCAFLPGTRIVGTTEERALCARVAAIAPTSELAADVIMGTTRPLLFGRRGCRRGARDLPIRFFHAHPSHGVLRVGRRGANRRHSGRHAPINVPPESRGVGIVEIRRRPSKCGHPIATCQTDA